MRQCVCVCVCVCVSVCVLSGGVCESLFFVYVVGVGLGVRCFVSVAARP